MIALCGIVLGSIMPFGAMAQTTEWTRFKLILDLHHQDHPEQSCVMIVDEQNPERAFALIGGNLVDMPSGVPQYRIPTQKFDHFLKNLPSKAMVKIQLDLEPDENYRQSIIEARRKFMNGNNRDIWMLTWCSKKSVLKQQVSQRVSDGVPIILGAEKKKGVSNSVYSKILWPFRKIYDFAEPYLSDIKSYFIKTGAGVAERVNDADLMNQFRAGNERSAAAVDNP